MQRLSPQESKKITIKFLKHFGCYDGEKLKKYFISGQVIPKISFFKFIYKFLTRSLPIQESIYSEANFKKYYEACLCTFFSTFEDDEKKINRLCKALEKTLIKSNIKLLYKIGAFSPVKNSSLLVEDMRDWNKIGGTDEIIFSENFSFLLEFDSDEAMLFYGSQKIINDFKKNYPDYQTDFTTS